MLNSRLSAIRQIAFFIPNPGKTDWFTSTLIEFSDGFRRSIGIFNEGASGDSRSSNMAKRRADQISIIRVRKGESLKSIYAKVRRKFTAGDLAKYAEEEEMIPAEQVLAELEAINREETVKRERKLKNAHRK